MTTMGESITLEELERDPYPIYQRLRGFEAKIVGEPLPSIEGATEPVS